MTGIDISQWQSAIAPGAWDFIFCRATHDGLGDDLMFPTHFANARARTARVGAYHFAKPTASSGAAQAQHFAQVCIAHGFRVGVDLWALDFEANALGSHAANVAWIREFMATARALLGGRAFLYVGWYFFTGSCGAENVALLHESPWWLPAYGVNDGQPHTYSAPFVPCVHQFTSRGGPNLSGLDVNRVLDTALWARTVSDAPAPKPAPIPAPVTIPTTEEDEVQTDISMKLDTHGDGHLPVKANGKGVKAKDVRSATVIATRDPDVAHRYDPIPRCAITIGTDGFAEVVVEGGLPSGPASIRVIHA